MGSPTPRPMQPPKLWCACASPALDMEANSCFWCGHPSRQLHDQQADAERRAKLITELRDAQR